MAGRPNKAGLDYFELDCHMDDKVKLIQAEFGLKGFAVVVKLYQKIYSGNGYYCEWNEDVLLLFMSENGLPSDNKNLITEIVAACIRRDIFSEALFKKYGILTSCGVQKRYLNATARRDNVELKKEYLLISVPKNLINVVINSINVNKNSINVGINAQSKVKESKVKDINSICSEPENSAPNTSGILIILNDKSFYDVPLDKIAMWKTTYPAVNVEQELKKMRAWSDSNPTKRKTRRGVERFINSWLSREQDRGGTKTEKEDVNEYNGFSVKLW